MSRYSFIHLQKLWNIVQKFKPKKFRNLNNLDN